MNVEEFIARYPAVWHTADARNLDGIKLSGLLSTSSLLDLFEVSPAARVPIESQRRTESVQLDHEVHGQALIRDQKPLDEAALERSLTDMSPRQWFEALNQKVYFWLDQVRLERMLNARPYASSPQVVLEIDTSKLVETHFDEMRFSPINSGAAFPAGPAPRGSRTFLSFADYPWDERAKTHPKELAVECAVLHGVPDINEMIIRESTRPQTL